MQFKTCEHAPISLYSYFKINWAHTVYPVFKKRVNFFLERGREGERGRGYQCVIASHVTPTGDLAHNPGTCP